MKLETNIKVYMQYNIPIWYEVTNSKINNGVPIKYDFVGLLENITDIIPEDKLAKCYIVMYNLHNVNFLTLCYDSFPIYLCKGVKIEHIQETNTLEEIMNFYSNMANTVNDYVDSDIQYSQILQQCDLILEHTNVNSITPFQVIEELPTQNLSIPRNNFYNSRLHYPTPKEDAQEKPIKLGLAELLQELKSEYNGKDKDFSNMDLLESKHLHINEGEIPKTFVVSKVWTELMTDYGVPFSISKIKELFLDSSNKMNEYDEKIRAILSTLLSTEISIIDYSSRNLNSTHIVGYLVSAGVIPKTHINFKTKATSLKMESILNYSENLKQRIKALEDLSHSYTGVFVQEDHNAELDILKYHLELLDNIYSYIKISKVKSNVTKLYKSVLNPGLKDVFDCTIYQEEDLALFKPSTSVLATNRIQVVKPNFQGLQPEIKSCIGYKSDYNIMALDIKGQDTHMLIFGVLQDKKLSELVIKHSDPILGILERCGIEPNPENRKIGKIPVLSIMNGKSIKTLLMETPEEHHTLVETVYKFIVENENYKSIVSKARYLYKTSSKVKKCLLGCESRIEYENAKGVKKQQHNVINSLINANFQSTSASVFNLSTQHFMYDLLNGHIKYNGETITKEHIKILVPVFDEIIIAYKDGYEELARRLLSYYYLPTILDWDGEMKSELTYGRFYIHK